MKRIVFLLSVVLLSACLREPESSELAKYMVVQTNYNQEFINDTDNIFDTYSTFVLREDTIGYVSTLTTKDYITESDLGIDGGYVVPVIDAVRNGFTQAGTTGFQQVTIDDDPDFAVNIIVLENFNYFQSVNYGYGYPGSYYYGYYGYYYPYVSTYYSNYVTLLIQVVDAKNPNANLEYPIIWTAYIGDLNATLDLRGKTLEAIEQAFIQSPYIRKD